MTTTTTTTTTVVMFIHRHIHRAYILDIHLLVGRFVLYPRVDDLFSQGGGVVRGARCGKERARGQRDHFIRMRHVHMTVGKFVWGGETHEGAQKRRLTRAAAPRDEEGAPGGKSDVEVADHEWGASGGVRVGYGDGR